MCCITAPSRVKPQEQLDQGARCAPPFHPPACGASPASSRIRAIERIAVSSLAGDWPLYRHLNEPLTQLEDHQISESGRTLELRAALSQPYGLEGPCSIRRSTNSRLLRRLCVLLKHTIWQRFFKFGEIPKEKLCTLPTSALAVSRNEWC